MQQIKLPPSTIFSLVFCVWSQILCKRKFCVKIPRFIGILVSHLTCVSCWTATYVPVLYNRYFRTFGSFQDSKDTMSHCVTLQATTENKRARCFCSLIFSGCKVFKQIGALYCLIAPSMEDLILIFWWKSELILLFEFPVCLSRIKIRLTIHILQLK